MYGRKKKEEKQTHNNFFYSSIQLKSSLCLWHITFYRVRTRGKETQRMKRCRNNNKLSTFISMEQFNVKWKIRQESIFHNSMLGCCSRTVITYTQSVNLSFFLFKKYKSLLAGLNWNHRKFYIPISFHRRRRAKLIDLIKLWTRPWLKLLCYLFCFVSVASLNWRWWVSLSSLLFLLIV